MAKYGYIGARPTQSSSSSSGVFSVNDVANALDQSIFPLQVMDVSYLIVAGGGGGAAGYGGGGAGGYRNSYASETSGGNSSTETPLTINIGTSYTLYNYTYMWWLKNCWSFSLQKLMQICSKVLNSKISNPAMSRMPMKLTSGGK